MVLMAAAPRTGVGRVAEEQARRVIRKRWEWKGKIGESKQNVHARAIHGTFRGAGVWPASLCIQGVRSNYEGFSSAEVIRSGGQACEIHHVPRAVFQARSAYPPPKLKIEKRDRSRL